MDVSANVYDLFTETSRFGHNLAVSLKKKGSAHNEKNDLPWIVGRGRCSPDDSRGLVHDMGRGGASLPGGDFRCGDAGIRCGGYLYLLWG